METINSLLTFITSYPNWAKAIVLVALGTIVVTLVFAPRNGASQPQPPSQQQPPPTNNSQHVYMKIRAIKLFPDNPNAEVQLSAFVNGTEYIHPSVAGVEWMKVGAGMSEKIIEIPKSERYYVRFELRIRGGGTLRQQVQVSQQVTPVKTLPYAEEYTLYSVDGAVRSAAVSAVVPYEIYTE